MPRFPLTSLALTLLFAPADAARAEGAPGPVLEMVSFRLMPGVTEPAFLAAAGATAAPLRDQPGFLGRRLTRSDDGVWSDLVLWSSLPEALAAAEVMMAEPTFGPFMAAIDMSTISMRHDRVLWQMD